MKYIISYDLGTGGTKASLFSERGVSVASAFVSCETLFPGADFREQRPEDWWQSVVTSTRALVSKSGVEPEEIACLAVSGHSLGAVPVAVDGRLLADKVPIWSDARAGRQAKRFFETVDEESWYLTTGNGFPPPLYAIFKIMWYQDHVPAVYREAKCFLGTKDYVNFKMTGVMCTDHSYASGSGVYSLKESRYLPEYIGAAGVDAEKLPDIFPSTHILGGLLPEAAAEMGLSPRTQVAAGGVDNACMALGAGCIGDGDAYTSLGTSAWIAVSSREPIVDGKKRPYVFAHCLPGRYVSAVAIFSAGNSFRWARGTLCRDLMDRERAGEGDAYDWMTREAEGADLGARRLFFVPSLAGGSSLDRSTNARGAYVGLDLMHTRADLLRATLEGICLNLRLALDVLGGYTRLSDRMLLVGGGGKSRFWRQLFASIYRKTILETNVGEDAGSLGAAALAAVGCGLWSDLAQVKEIHQLKNEISPIEEDARRYDRLLPAFARVSDQQSDAGDLLASLPEFHTA